MTLDDLIKRGWEKSEAKELPSSRHYLLRHAKLGAALAVHERGKSPRFLLTLHITSLFDVESDGETEEEALENLANEYDYYMSDLHKVRAAFR